MTSYFIKTNKQRKPQGPFSGDQLQQLARLGKLLPTHFVSPDNGKTWQTANRFSSLDFKAASSDSLSVNKMAPDTCTRLTSKLAKQAHQRSLLQGDQHQSPTQSFRLRANTIYQWKIVPKDGGNSSPSGYVSLFAERCGVVLLAFSVTYFVCWLIGLLSTNIAFWVVIFIVSVGTITAVGAVLTPMMGATNDYESQQNRAEAKQFGSLFALGGLFYLLNTPETSFAEGFRSPQGFGLWPWTVFFFENLGTVMLFDIPELVFGYHFYSITWDSQSSRAVVVLIRVLMVIGIIQMLMPLLRRRYQTIASGRMTYLCSLTDIATLYQAHGNGSQVAIKQAAFDQANEAHLKDVSDESNRKVLNEAKNALASAKQTKSGIRIQCQGKAISFPKAVSLSDRELSGLNKEWKRTKEDIQPEGILYARRIINRLFRHSQFGIGVLMMGRPTVPADER